MDPNRRFFSNQVRHLVSAPRQRAPARSQAYHLPLVSAAPAPVDFAGEDYIDVPTENMVTEFAAAQEAIFTP